MTEADVTLTDYVLSLQSAGLAFALARTRRTSGLGRSVLLLFIALSLGAAVGGTHHGFFQDPSHPAHQASWWLTLALVGLSAVGFALVGLELLLGRLAAPVTATLLVLFAAYLVLTWRRPDFLLAIVFSVPATLLCLAGLIASYRGRPDRDVGLGIGAIGLSLAAAAVQQLEISLHPVYLTHNALYHILLMIALYLFYRAARSVIGAES